jgi:selenide,water dikinase
VLADAQTSGGLLLAVPSGSAATLVRRLRDEGHEAAIVGELAEPTERGAGIDVV